MKPVQRALERRGLTATLLVMLALASGFVDADEAVTEGSLRYTDAEHGVERLFPLEHTSVDVTVSGTIADVTVRQRFSNPLASRIEAVYVFPLPDRAAVDAMTIVMGDRRIEGEIQRRDEARRIYEEARRAGHAAGLLDQERPNIFTQRLANILPGETVEVEIHYVEDLHFDHGTWKLVFPTVVGPRYIPGSPTGRSGAGWAPDTDQVPDASRITPPVLPPGERSGHDIEISVLLEPGFAIRDLASPSHEIRTTRRGSRRATVSLAPLDTIPNKDFVLTWSTGDAAIRPAVVTHRAGETGYLTLILQPPAQPSAEQVVPREVVFVLDTSGSMSGEPVAACKQLVRKALKQLRPDDTFRLIRFAGRADQLSVDALPVSRVNIERALSYLDGMRGSGGTEMLAGVRAALGAAKDPYRLRMVLFLTDGYIGNEDAIIREVSAQLGDARVFSFGVGNSVNRYLLDRLAEAGRGRAEYLRPGERPDALVQRFYERITDPVFTQLELDWGDLEVVDVEPAALPDLFAGQPLLVHARYRSGGRGDVSLRGWAGRERIEVSTRVRLPEREPANASQARLWARSRIARLEMERAGASDPPSLIERITTLALEHRLMTAYTSFVAVDRSEIRDHGSSTTVDQPLPMPEGVSYEGVFGTFAPDNNLQMKVARKTTSMMNLPQTYVRKTVPSPAGEAVVLGLPDAPPPPEPRGPMRYVVGGALTEPEKLTGDNPEYPEAARSARVQGVVVLELTIDESGSVTAIQVLRPLPLGLTEAAVTAIQSWRFKPSTLHGRPTASKYVMTVRFNLFDQAAPGGEPSRAEAPPAAVGTTRRETGSSGQERPGVPESSAVGERAGPEAPPVSAPAVLPAAIGDGAATQRDIRIPSVSIAILAPSLVLLIFATGAWLAQRRVAAP